ncbi:tetratricopeptide repeat protein [Massilia aerilata]|uniref:Tetratricopeptide repeat protein n=1 Tax=Massilia aerilata TaxID=453817 RepID=A0ABW0RZF8_9BURK
MRLADFRRLLPLALLSASMWCGAAPHIPADGSQVVERLPSRADPVQRELLRLRGELSRQPGDLGLATTLARRYIEQARIEGDPRYLGYAEAALAPWWKENQPPEQVLVLRATLRQSTHQFGAALADLDLAVKRDSDNVQAWLTRATVQMVTGDLAAARGSCMRLYSRAPALVVQTCLSSVGSIAGDGAVSYRRLLELQARRPPDTPDIGIWVQTLLAEMAARAGDDAAAEGHFRKALGFKAPDSYLLGAWADFLLNHGRAEEVARLLKDKTRVDALLLRYALALAAMKSPEAAAQTAALGARFDAAQLRGDTVHRREQARFELALRADAAAAVRLAKANWAVQKEPADLRILADCALASGDPDAARLVRDWLRSSRIEDRRIAATAARLRVPA